MMTYSIYQGEKEEKKRLELEEEKREQVIAPASCLVHQARLDTLPSTTRVARKNTRD